MVKSILTGEDINEKHKEEQNDTMLKMAQNLFKSMDIKVPEAPICFMHKRPFIGPFIEFVTRERETVPICMPCVNRALDKIIYG